MQRIPLTQGKYALVDNEDFALVSRYKWYLHKTHNGEYAASRQDGKRLYMHRLIMGVTEFSQKVDHRNGNTLDNRRAELRLSTNTENAINSKTPTNNTSGYKGVAYLKSGNRSNRWMARLGSRFIGYFATKEEAALAYNKTVSLAYGEFAKLNEVQI